MTENGTLTAADVAAVTRNNDYGGGMFGNDWAWIIILLLFGYGGRGFGFGGGGGMCCGSPATQADLAAGFNNSAVLSGINDLKFANCQGFNGIQRSIDGVRYDMAKECCDTRAAIYNSTRDVIDNANCNTRAILDFLTKDKIETLQQENQSLRLAASQANQNAVLMAAMDANVATILRRTGAECPSAAYIVQPPTPVTFPVNACGQAQFGWGGGCGGCTG